MPFIDIAFQAEVSRYEDPDFEEFASKKCNENPDTRGKAIEELRRLILDRGECSQRRMDDAYLIRFLRCRRFIPALAHKLMVRYENFHRKNGSLYHCDAFNLQVGDVCGSSFPDSPDSGRIIFMKLGKWDPNELSVEDCIRCALLMDEVAVMQPKIQILGLSIIIDLDGLSLRHARHINPTLASQIVDMMGLAFPLRLNGVHFINYTWILNTFFYMFKQLVPKAAWGRIHFHGSDVRSLHKEIDPAYLPPDYGGSCQYVYTGEEWLAKIKQYKDDFMVQELKDLGFMVTD